MSVIISDAPQVASMPYVTQVCYPGKSPDDKGKGQIAGGPIPGTAGNDATIRPNAICSQIHTGSLSRKHRGEHPSQRRFRDCSRQ